MAFSPDGKRLACAGGMHTVDIWDISAGSGELTKPVLSLKGHTGGPIYSVAFSPDGKRIASAGQDKLVKIWETSTGQELLSLQGHTNLIWSVAFSADGRRLASESMDGTVKIWEAARGTAQVLGSRPAARTGP